MDRAERLFLIVREMRSRGFSRAESLAECFDVSQRTIYRDIAYLQARGVPIQGEAGFGYVMQSSMEVPPVSLTPQQSAALALGLTFVEEGDDLSLSNAAVEVRAKLKRVLQA